MRVYLDHNATTPLDPRVGSAVIDALVSLAGNPSSVHAEGRAARDAVETARREVAELCGGRADEVIFTSGGTEADALGVVGLARLARAGGRPARVVAPAIEHPAVLGAITSLVDAGFDVGWADVDADGRVGAEAVRAACQGAAALVCCALANHELGTVQELAAVAEVAAAAGALVHCDAVQAAGRLRMDVASLGVDSLAISGHKLHGPKGVGALWVRRGLALAPLVPAGAQERGRRPGTENVAAVVGLGRAAALVRAEALAAQPSIAARRDRLERGILAISGARIHARAAPRLANTCNAAFAGAPGDVVVQALDLAGIAASTGAACSSGRVEPSPVLRALGEPAERAAEAVRFSLGAETDDAAIDAVLAVLPAIVERARRFTGA
jgi:cysteine desulfurase